MSSMTPSRLGLLLFVCAVAATIHGAARADDALVVTASDLVIAERGKAPKYDIVIPEKPTVWQRHAASELRKWTKELTGVELAICEGKGAAPCHIRLIEPEPHLSLGDEGFNLRTEKSDVVVRGGRRGMLYGVNELLETYGGIGWFSPWRTVVPKTGVLKVPDSLYDTQRPAFEMRYTDFYWCGDNDWSGQNVEPKREFFVHCRQNGAFKIRLQEKYGGFADAGLFVGGAGLCHTFLRLVPPAKYFKDHPEYYSEVGGVRRNGETQLCLTNPEVLEILVSNLVVKIDADPQAKFYGVSQADWENYCTCAKCRAIDEEEGSHAGTLIRFVNAVAARIEKIRPGLTCETLAYQYTRKPPKKTRPAKNVAICFCNIECDHSLPLSAAGTATNAAFLDDFVAWSALTDNLYFWDYITNFRWSFHAFPNLNSMQQNVKFFRDHGVRWLFEEGTCMHSDFFGLKCWLISKWMWNPDLPAEPLLQRFFEGYYGAAAPYARAVSDKFTLALANAPINPRRLGIFENDRPNVYTDSLLNEALALAPSRTCSPARRARSRPSSTGPPPPRRTSGRPDTPRNSTPSKRCPVFMRRCSTGSPGNSASTPRPASPSATPTPPTPGSTPPGRGVRPRGATARSPALTTCSSAIRAAGEGWWTIRRQPADGRRWRCPCNHGPASRSSSITSPTIRTSTTGCARTCASRRCRAARARRSRRS